MPPRMLRVLLEDISLSIGARNLNNLPVKSYYLPSLLVLALIGWQGHVCPVAAATNSFTIDPAQTSVVLSGSVSGNPLNPQGPGSLSNQFTGTLIVDVTPSTIQFSGGSLIDAFPNGTWQPLPGGGAGSAPADYAGTVNLFLVTGVAAIRNILLDVTSPVLPLQNGQFDSSSLAFRFLTNSGGSVDYRVTGLASSSGSQALDGLATNGVTTAASLTDNGSLLTLVIPVDATQVLTFISTNDTTLRLQGQLVATAPAGEIPLVVSIQINGGQIILEWPSSSGQTFSVETTPDFSLWMPAPGTIVVGPDKTTWTGDPGGDLQFYRVARNPP